jgi:hypothetical protein
MQQNTSSDVISNSMFSEISNAFVEVPKMFKISSKCRILIKTRGGVTPSRIFTVISTEL